MASQIRRKKRARSRAGVSPTLITIGGVVAAGLVGVAVWLASHEPQRLDSGTATLTAESLDPPVTVVAQAPVAGASAPAAVDPYAAMQAELAEPLPAKEAKSSVPVRTVSAPVKDTEGEAVRVTRVVDGDTVVLEDGRKVRLVGMNTPERGCPLYREATKALEELALNQEVVLRFDVERTDMYGRTLGYLYVGDLFLNGEIVRQGLAYCYTWKPNVAHVDELRELQRQARAEGLGLWGLAAPEPASRYVASARAHRFHRDGCRRARRAKVTWSERNAALDAGFNPCRDCDS